MDGRWVSAGRRGIHANAVDLTSGAIAGVRAPSGGQVALWAFPSPDGELLFESDHAITDWHNNFDGDYLPNQSELRDDAVDKVGVPIEFYNIVN